MKRIACSKTCVRRLMTEEAAVHSWRSRFSSATGLLARDVWHRRSRTRVTAHYACQRTPTGSTATAAAGQSFGAFLPEGVLDAGWSGDANDYFGKGLSGGKLVVYPPKGSRLYSRTRTSSSATWRCMAPPAARRLSTDMAGERFCVRNSGAHRCRARVWGTTAVNI